MTYLSHTVRSLLRDPIPGETVRLVLTLADDADPDEIRAEIESLDGEYHRELQFDRILVTVDRERLAAVAELDGVTEVETDAVLGYPS